MKKDYNLDIEYTPCAVRIKNARNFCLADTLDCGQAFRWYEKDGKWYGIAHSTKLCLFNDGDDVVIEGVSEAEFESVWRAYFDLDRDYSAVIDAVKEDKRLNKICALTGGIRLLRQDPWEALCSFIISQNNNIPRIKGIVERLCQAYGNDLGDGAYSFPQAEKIAALTVEDLAPIRAGFRAKYIIDAAKKVASGQVPINELCNMDVQSAAEALMLISGVGPKVAACTLLFGCGHIECFPVDVWIKRAMEVMFSDGLPDYALPYAGIVQQYIFHYARLTGLDADKMGDI